MATEKQFNHLKVSKLNNYSTVINLIEDWSSYMFLFIFNTHAESPYGVALETLVHCVGAYFKDDLALSKLSQLLVISTWGTDAGQRSLHTPITQKQ